MVKNVVKGFLNGKTDHNMKENFSIIIYKVKVYTNGVEIRNMKVDGFKIK